MSPSLLDLLIDAAEAWPDKGLSVPGRGRRSFPGILAAARRVAGGLAAAGVGPADPVLILVLDNADFVPLYWGALWRGATPVPLAGPRDTSQEEMARVGRVMSMLGGQVVVDRGLRFPGLELLDAGDLLDGEPQGEPAPPDAPALIQFSSGSTREPRGVVLSHANLVTNVEQLTAALPIEPSDVKLTWMPHFHDMGLIGCHLLPMKVGMEQVRVDPRDALGDPRNWLRLASDHGASVLSTTNFAMARANRYLREQGRPEELDLSRVRWIFNGAEPISPDVCREFSRLTGVPEAAHWPMYGLAEACVGVVSSAAGGVVTHALEGREVMELGPPLPEVALRVLDDDGAEVAEGAIGHVQFRGPNATEGYWRDPDATAALFDGGWLRTGDLGTVIDGRLVLTGRHKDVICVAGRNLHAHDVEEVAEAVEGVRGGGALAFADGRTGVEQLALAVRLDEGRDAAPVLWEVHRRVIAATGVEPSVVVPIPRVPRTTSGKKRRAQVRVELEQGALDTAAGNTWQAVRAIWEQALRRPLDQDDLERPFRDLGGTSVMAQEILSRLERRFGLVPDHRILLEGETVHAMARHLERAGPFEGRVPAEEVAPRREPVAVVAAALRVPGADTAEQFWALARDGGDQLGPPPAGRWRGGDQGFVGGFLDDVATFDAERFRIPAAEAAAMDPQQRLLLTVAAEALERAGVADTRAVGVFVGAGQQAYLETVLEHLDDDLPPGTMAGNLLNMIAARVSHHLDLRGPALAVDTACSASLVAVHLACQSLWAGECDWALAGGVNLNLSPTAFKLFQRSGALSPTGRCRPFEEDADGMIPGEGAGVVVLAPLSRALAAGHPVLGVIRAVAVNNDGSSLGVMAPNPAGQEEVIRRALARASLDPAEVSFIEAHGTGTPIGDPVERSVLGRLYPHGPRVGAIKGQIGHLLAAAGVAGLIRAMGEIGPGEAAAVSSFGFGGTNAHALLSGPPEGARTAMHDAAPVAGARHWLGEGGDAAAGWVHLVRRDPAGGLEWRPCPQGETPLRAGGRYLITGGSGALGGALAMYLAERYGARLALLGRRPEDDGLRARLAALEEAGGEARYWAVDLADAQAAAAAVRDARRWLDGVDGLFHLAGSSGAHAGRDKLDSLAHVEAAVEPGFTVLFSSISAVIPGLDRGIEDYAEANRVLDRSAEQRHRDGRRVISIAWPPWVGEGMAAGSQEALRARGIEPIAAPRAMAALEWALGSGQPHVVVLRRAGDALDAPPLPEDLRERLRALLARTVGRAPEQIGDGERLAELGVDSLEAMELVKELEQITGRALPTTLLYEFETLDAIVAALQGGAAREEPVQAAEDDAGQPAGPAHIPLLPSQQTFVVQRAFFPDIPGNVFLACTVTSEGGGGLDRAALEGALAAVIARHLALRSVIRKDGEDWVFVEGGAVPRVEWQAEVDEAAVMNAPFDLERGPLLRVVTDGRRLVLDAHHAAVDAWSLKNVLEELLAAHAALAAGQAPALSALGADWSEASAALRDAGGGSVDWWRERYARGVPPVPLPWDGPADAPAAGPCGAHHEILSTEDTRRLEERAREAGVSLPALVLASYLRCLWEWSGQHDLTVRVAHGRREIRVPDAPRLVGSFADSLPVRVALEAGESLEQLARRVADELAQAQAHAGASSLALASMARRGAAGPVGLTPAGFSFPLLPARSEIGGLSIGEVRGASASGFTRVGLIAWVFDGRLHASWNHAHSHLRPDTMRRLAGEHRTLLERLARGDDAQPAPDQLHRRVLARCRMHPDRVAIESTSYGELDRRSGALAGRLRGELVGVLAAPGADAVVALLAVLRAGAAYVPLEPSWPDRRVQQVLEAARPQVLVTTPDLAERAAALAGGAEVVPVGRDEVEDGPDERGTLAYVMFTSGSTGRPKGVKVPHTAVLAFHDWVARVFGVTERDRFVQTSSLAFGGSIRQIWSPLQAGATVHPVSRDITRDPDALIQFLRERRITIWNSVPSLCMHLLDAVERTGAEDPLPDLRWVLLGGEVVPAAHARRWRARFGDRHRLANLYGSTETIVNATWHEVIRTPGEDEVHTPIGWARAGQTVHLLDERDGVGEIVVGGAVAQGYLGDPEATAEAFAEVTGLGRVYRTGDLARRAEDGSLIYLGRRDSQVQIHGNRVELGEIEATLCGHPEVEHAVVVEQDGRLFATVQRQGGEGAEPAALRAWLEQRLPHFMVPHRIEAVDALPRTAVGKADRRRLAQAAPAPPAAGGSSDGASIMSLLASIWAEVLELPEPPGPDDDFFALGGDSLLALVVLERLRRHVADVPRPLVLYRHRRLADLAAALESPVVAPACAPSTPLPAAPVPEDGADLPLSPVQRGFWLAHQLRPETPPTWCASVPLHGPLDGEAFARALAWAVQRHPMLRTTFHESFQGPVQRVLAGPRLPVLQRDDLAGLPAEIRAGALEARWQEEAAARYDLERGPLFRARLCRLADDEHQLIIGAHHVIADAWSAWLLAGEVIRAHDAFRDGRVPELPPPAGSFREEAGARERDDPWWAEALAGITQQAAPPRERTVEGEVHLEEAAWQGLRSRARALAVTPYLLVLSALGRTLQELLDDDDVVIATALTGRDGREEQLAGVVGPYATGLPVRLRGAATPEVVSRAFGEAYAHADASPARIAAAAGPVGVRALGRFFLSWLEPASVPLPVGGSLEADWAAGRYRFATQSTDTEVMVGALADRGLHLNLHGGPLVEQVVPRLQHHLEQLTRVEGALVVYAPDDVPIPVRQPLVVERVDAAVGSSELVLLPLPASALADTADLDRRVAEAVACTDARVVGLAGMLPALTGLGTRPDLGPERVLTTGHAATVVAMVRTVERALRATGLRWSDLRVGVLGHGSIGQAVLALARHRLGDPGQVLIQDPRHPDTVADLSAADWILGATSGGRALDVAALAPGTVVIDDSFPRAFDDAAAVSRMREAADVLLVGGGMIDAGPLLRSSPFPGADALRQRFGARWLPGCHAEVLLLAARPDLGPTVGAVTPGRAQQIWEAVEALGWDAPPLHLGNWEVPAEVVRGVAAETAARRS